MGWEWGRATVKSRDRDQEHSVWCQLSLGHRTGLVKTVVTFNNLDETGGHRQSEPCRPEGQTLKDSTCMRNLQQSNSEAGSRMVVAETRGRGKWGTAVCVCTRTRAHTHTQSCPTLCDPMDCRLPGSSVHGILQARTLEWVAISSSRGSSRPRNRTRVSHISCIGRWILYHWDLDLLPPYFFFFFFYKRKQFYSFLIVDGNVPINQSCPALCDPMDYSSPDSSVHGILQARMLEWVAIPSLRGASRPRDWTHISYVSCIGRLVLYHYCHLGSPITAPLTGLSGPWLHIPECLALGEWSHHCGYLGHE